MSKPVSRSQSPEGQTIWEGVSRAAKSAPAWVQPKISKAANDSATKIAQEASAKKK